MNKYETKAEGSKVILRLASACLYNFAYVHRYVCRSCGNCSGSQHHGVSSMLLLDSKTMLF